MRKVGTFGLTEGAVALPAAPLAGRWSLAGLIARVRAVRVQLLVLLAFLGLAGLLLGSIWTSPATRTLGAGVGDPGLFAWFLRWTPFAAGRHISPFASDYLNHPDGINLMWNTWLPLPGLLLSPLTLLFGPVLTFNVLVTLAYGLSAWSAYLAIHRYVPSHGAAACGGLVYGFSPAMVGHSHHPNLILIFLLPWLFVLLDEILDRQRRSPVWLGVGLGAVAAAQLLTGAEVFAGMVLLGLVLLVLLVAANRHALRDKGRYAATALAVSVVVFEVLVVLPLRAQIAGPARVHADLTEEVRGSSDLLALATPSRLLAIAPEAAVRLGDQFAGTRETYLGIPLLLVVALVVARRRSPVVRVGAAMLVVCMVLSLGSRLRVGGLVTLVPLPWAAVESLPVLWHMVPARLALFTALFAGLLLAVALDALWCGRGRAAGPGRRRRPGGARLPGSVGAPQSAPGGGHAGVLHQLGGGRAPAGRGRPRGPVSPEGPGQPGHAVAGRGRHVVQDARWLLRRPRPRRRHGARGAAEHHLAHPRPDPAGRAPPRPDPATAPPDGPGLRQMACPFGGPRPDAAPPGHGRVPQRPARPRSPARGRGRALGRRLGGAFLIFRPDR